MNIKTLVIGMFIGGVISTGTYFLSPPPKEAEAREKRWFLSNYKIFSNSNHNFFEFRLKTNPNILCVFGESETAPAIFCVSSPKE